MVRTVEEGRVDGEATDGQEDEPACAPESLPEAGTSAVAASGTRPATSAEALAGALLHEPLRELGKGLTTGHVERRERVEGE